MWRTLTNTPMTVVNVYPDAVTYRYSQGGQLHAAELTYWLAYATPPEPTVMESRWLVTTTRTFGTSTRSLATATHRLDYLSDGEFRVVKL